MSYFEQPVLRAEPVPWHRHCTKILSPLLILLSSISLALELRLTAHWPIIRLTRTQKLPAQPVPCPGAPAVHSHCDRILGAHCNTSNWRL